MGRKKIGGLRLRGGIWHIQKSVRGYGFLHESTGTGDRAQAEQVLVKRLEELRQAVVFGIRPKRRFRDVAAHYLLTQAKKSLMDEASHLKQVVELIGELPLDQIHDATLSGFVIACRGRGNKAKTINLKLAVVRRILNLAAASWRDERTGLTWLQQAPKITMLPVRDARSPHPLSWAEQRLLFGLLPGHLQRMALFAVHTGARDEEICGLRWEDEVEIPELKTSVFALPTSKNGLPRLIVLNAVARSVVEQCRGLHPEYVFVYRGHRWKEPRRVATINNTAWQNARKRAAELYQEALKRPCPSGFQTLHVHDLRHTAGRRLRAAGVGLETRRAILGHANGDITTHYSAAEVAELIAAVSKIEGGESAPVLTLIRASEMGQNRGTKKQAA